LGGDKEKGIRTISSVRRVEEKELRVGVGAWKMQ
jgi:hypothetical protein